MRSKFCELLAIRGVDGLMISFVSNVKFELHAKVIKQISTIKFSGLQCFSDTSPYAENTQHKGKYHCTAHLLFFYLDSAALHLFY